MTTRILVDGSTAMGKQVLEYVDAVLTAKQKGERLVAALNSMSWGDDWAHLATELGLPAPVEGDNKAQDTWSIVSNAQTVVASAAVAELARLDQG